MFPCIRLYLPEIKRLSWLGRSCQLGCLSVRESETISMLIVPHGEGNYSFSVFNFVQRPNTRDFAVQKKLNFPSSLIVFHELSRQPGWKPASRPGNECIFAGSDTVQQILAVWGMCWILQTPTIPGQKRQLVQTPDCSVAAISQNVRVLVPESALFCCGSRLEPGTLESGEAGRPHRWAAAVIKCNYGITGSLLMSSSVWGGDWAQRWWVEILSQVLQSHF